MFCTDSLSRGGVPPYVLGDSHSQLFESAHHNSEEACSDETVALLTLLPFSKMDTTVGHGGARL